MARKTNYEKNGNAYYRTTAVVGKSPDGKPIRKEFYGKSKTEAEDKKMEYLQALRNGLAIDYNKVKLGELMEQWLFEVLQPSGKIKPSTFDRYEGIYRNHIKKSELNSLLVSEIKSIQIQRLYNRLYEKKVTPSTIKHIHKTLRYFFNYCITEDFILKNPCFRLTIPGDASEREESSIDPFTDEEIKKINQACKEHAIGTLVLLALATGLRQGELLALTPGDVNLETNEVTVSKNIKYVKDIKRDKHEYKFVVQTPKTKRSIRTIPIPSGINAMLKKHIKNQKELFLKNGIIYKDSDLLFTTQGCNVYDATNVRRSFERMLKGIGVRYRNFHTLRHTYATKLFEADVPLKTVSSLLGHANINITANTYTHVMPKTKEKATEKLNRFFI